MDMKAGMPDQPFLHFLMLMGGGGSLRQLWFVMEANQPPMLTMEELCKG